MKLHLLFTETGKKVWIETNCHTRAIAYVWATMGQGVACWFLGCHRTPEEPVVSLP